MQKLNSFLILFSLSIFITPIFTTCPSSCKVCYTGYNEFDLFLFLQLNDFFYSTTYCTTCNEGYYKIGYMCAPCSTGCKSCKNATYCYSCMSGNTLQNHACTAVQITFFIYSFLKKTSTLIAHCSRILV